MPWDSVKDPLWGRVILGTAALERCTRELGVSLLLGGKSKEGKKKEKENKTKQVRSFKVEFSTFWGITGSHLKFIQYAFIALSEKN